MAAGVFRPSGYAGFPRTGNFIHTLLVIVVILIVLRLLGLLQENLFEKKYPTLTGCCVSTCGMHYPAECHPDRHANQRADDNAGDNADNDCPAFFKPGCKLPVRHQ